MQTYHYNPLEDGEIRLLTLHAGNREERIHCSLRNAQLPCGAPSSASRAHDKSPTSKSNSDNNESKPEIAYDAVSYCWGDQNDRVAISLDDCEFEVGRNLESALRHLRLSASDRILWIDAICINQDDFEERGRQVLRMGKIYQRAITVRVWLGPEKDASGMAMKWMADSPAGSLYDTGTDMSILQESVEGPSSSWSSSRRRDIRQERGASDVFSSNARMIGAACQLMSRPWFSRRWVIQEIAFASRAVVHCGYMSVYWRQFAEAIRSLPRIWKQQIMVHGNSWLRHAGPRLFGVQTSPGSSGYWGDPDAQSASRLLFASRNVVDRVWNNSRPQIELCELHTLVGEFASFDVSDPCDTIYALLPLANDSHLWKPTYSNDVMEIYRDFISYAIQASGSLDILLRPWARSYSNLPSWVAVSHGPKFAMVGGRSLRQHAELFIGSPQSRIYTASSDLKPKVGLPESPKSGISQLRVTGILLDTVVRERGPSTVGTPVKNWPSWILEAAEEKGADVAECTLDDLFRTGNFPDEDHFPVVFTRRWLVTEEGRLGLGPARTSRGDEIVILLGCSVPVVLRKEETCHVIIGECYIQGVMDGEAVEGIRNGTQELQEFLLI